MEELYDVAVLGGGPAGYVAAIKAAQLSASVVLFERGVLGGTCLNRGCVPTKTYVKTAELIREMETMDKRGVHIDSPVRVNMAEVVANKSRVVKRLTTGVGSLLKSNGVAVVTGEAALHSENSVSCNGTVYRAKHIILCGGSYAGGLPIPGANDADVLNSDGILELTELPETLAIIGGGVIGCELATAFSAFGSRVSIVELADRVLPTFDEEVSAAVAKSLKAAGVNVLTGQKVQHIARENGKLSVVTESESISGDKVLLSIGRRADLSCLGALKERIALERGKVVVDEHMRTSVENIFAAGDINGRCMLAHAAFEMGEIAAETAVTGESRRKPSVIPSCVYTTPEVGCVGLSEAAARNQYGENLIVGRFPFAANGRALASGMTEGFVKVLAEKIYGEIVGVHIVGGAATEMIAEAAALMDMEITVHEAADIVHAHPTCSEAFMEACADALNRCIHMPRK